MPESTTATPMPLPFTAGVFPSRAPSNPPPLRGPGQVGTPSRDRTRSWSDERCCRARWMRRLQHPAGRRAGSVWPRRRRSRRARERTLMPSRCGRGLNRRDVAAHDCADRTIVAVDDEVQQVGRQQIADQRQEQFVDQRSDNRQVAEQRAKQAGLGTNRGRHEPATRQGPTSRTWGRIVSRRNSSSFALATV